MYLGASVLSFAAGEVCSRDKALSLAFAFRTTRCGMAWLAAIEAGSIFDIHLGLGAFLPCMPFYEAVRAGGVCFASNWPLSLGPRRASASLWLRVKESAPDEGAHFFIVPGAALHKGCQLGTERGIDVIRALVSLCRFPVGGVCDSRRRSIFATGLDLESNAVTLPASHRTC